MHDADESSISQGDPANGVVEELRVSTDELTPPETLDAQFRAIHGAISEIAGRLDNEAERAAARERVIDHLHGEVERLRAAERVGLLRPVVVDLCRLRDDLLQQAAGLPADLDPSRFVQLLRSYADSVGESLERCGVAVLATEPGSLFEPDRQKAVAQVEVDDPQMAGRVTEVVRDGYVEIDSGKVVAPARVKLARIRAEIDHETARPELRATEGNPVD